MRERAEGRPPGACDAPARTHGTRDARTARGAHGDDDEPRRALDGRGAAQDDVPGTLGDPGRLSRQRRFVHVESPAGGRTQHHAIGGDAGEAVGIHAQDVAHHDVVVRHADVPTAADDHLGVGLVQAPREPDEGELLPIVNRGRDQHHDQHGGQDRRPLDPAGAAPLSFFQPDGRLHDDPEDAEDEEHDEHEILQGVPHQRQEAVQLPVREGVGPEGRPPPVQLRRVVGEARLGVGTERDRRQGLGGPLHVARGHGRRRRRRARRRPDVRRRLRCAKADELGHEPFASLALPRRRRLEVVA